MNSADVQKRMSIALEFRGADAWNALQAREAVGAGARDLDQGRIVKDDVGGHTMGFCRFAAPGMGGRPVRVEQAQGILVAALVLARWYGYGSR